MRWLLIQRGEAGNDTTSCGDFLLGSSIVVAKTPAKASVIGVDAFSGGTDVTLPFCVGGCPFKEYLTPLLSLHAGDTIDLTLTLFPPGTDGGRGTTFSLGTNYFFSFAPISLQNLPMPSIFSMCTEQPPGTECSVRVPDTAIVPLQFNITADTEFQAVWTEPFILAAAVPEPSTLAMMILGLFGVGFMAYRREGALHPT